MNQRAFAAAVVLGLGLSSIAVAEPIAVENFAYPPGNLATRNGGTGWGGAWVASSAFESVHPTGLTYQVGGGGLIGDDGSGALRLTGNTTAVNEIAMRPIAPFAGDSLYVSYLFRLEAGAVDSADFLALWFDNTTGTSHNNSRPNIGVADDPAEEFYARLDFDSPGAWTVRDGGLVASARTYLVVGRLSKSNPGAGNPFDRFSLWVNPDADDLATPMATAEGATIATINRVGFRTSGIDGSDVLVVDELRLGTSWGDVVAVPLPSTAATAVALVGVLTGTRTTRRARRRGA